MGNNKGRWTRNTDIPTIRCPRCGGTGCAPGAAVDAANKQPYGTKPILCGQCAGKGKVPGLPEPKEPRT